MPDASFDTPELKLSRAGSAVRRYFPDKPNGRTERANDQARPRTSVGKIQSGIALMEKRLPPMEWAIREILPTGYNILAGRPKLGKSWIAVQAALAVARGDMLFGQECKPRPVLLLALEDGERRLQSRVSVILNGAPMPSTFSYALSWQRLDDDGLEQIDNWARDTGGKGLCIIDTYAKIKPRPSGRVTNAYDIDVENHSKLHDLTRTHDGLTLVSIMHMRKGATGGDYLEAVSGSAGITGTADATLALTRDRGKADATLSGTGRDLRDYELALQQEHNGPWKCLGAAAPLRMSATRQTILATLAGGPKSPAEIATLTDLSSAVVRKRLSQMAVDGHVVSKGGKYELAT
jgi:hypothetical protein